MEPKEQKILEQGYDIENTQQQRLITVLGELEDEVEKQNSWKHVFIRGALNGLGTVIGATVLIAIVGSLIALTVKSLGIKEVPFLGHFIEKVVVEQLNRQK